MFHLFLERFFFLTVHRGRHRSQQASVESLDAHTYEENLVEHLARSLKRSGFTGVTVNQARCNAPKYTLAVFDMFRVFCNHNLNVS